MSFLPSQQPAPGVSREPILSSHTWAGWDAPLGGWRYRQLSEGQRRGRGPWGGQGGHSEPVLADPSSQQPPQWGARRRLAARGAEGPSVGMEVGGRGRHRPCQPAVPRKAGFLPG